MALVTSYAALGKAEGKTMTMVSKEVVAQSLLMIALTIASVNLPPPPALPPTLPSH